MNVFVFDFDTYDGDYSNLKYKRRWKNFKEALLCGR